jgi:predicted RecB family endonuclease
VWNLVEIFAVWAWTILHQLHVESPRLEGLLIGVLLTWFLMRREKHPVLRLLSAPLKLVVDIMDLAWDQLVESLGDLKDACLTWWNKSVSAIRSVAKKSSDRLMSSLRSLKEKLLKKKNEEE